MELCGWINTRCSFPHNFVLLKEHFSQQKFHLHKHKTQAAHSTERRKIRSKTPKWYYIFKRINESFLFYCWQTKNYKKTEKKQPTSNHLLNSIYGSFHPFIAHIFHNQIANCKHIHLIIGNVFKYSWSHFISCTLLCAPGFQCEMFHWPFSICAMREGVFRILSFLLFIHAVFSAEVENKNSVCFCRIKWLDIQCTN